MNTSVLQPKATGTPATETPFLIHLTDLLVKAAHSALREVPYLFEVLSDLRRDSRLGDTDGNNLDTCWVSQNTRPLHLLI